MLWRTHVEGGLPAPITIALNAMISLSSRELTGLGTRRAAFATTCNYFITLAIMQSVV